MISYQKMKVRPTPKHCQKIIEKVSAGFGLFDGDGNIIMVNQALADLLGYAREEMVGENFSFVDFFADELIEYKLFFSRLTTEKEVRNYEALLKNRTGKKFTVLINANVIELDGREFVEAILVSIAEQRQKKSTARWKDDELELLRFITDNAAGEIYLVREDMSISYVNNSACRSLGYSRKDLLKMKVSDFDLDYTPEVWKDYFKEMKHSHGIKTVETRHVDKNGKIRIKEMTSRYIESQSRGKGYILGIGIDITEQKELKKELIKSEKRFQQLFELAPDGILGVSLDDRIIFWNQAAKNILGYSDKNLKDMPVQILFSNPQTILHLKESLKQGHDSIKIESRLKKKDGDTFPSAITLWVERDTTGKVLCTYGILRDISQAKELEKETLELEKLSTTKILLKKSEQEKAELEESILQNINTLLFPILDKLKNTQSPVISRNYLSLLEENLRKIASPFLKKLSTHYQKFSPREVEVANLIKDGRSTKEIADILLLTPTAINFHRKNIRKKLGLAAKKQNLQVFLKSLS